MRTADTKQSYIPGDIPCLRWLSLAMFSVLLLLQGCGGGASTTSNSNTNTPVLVTYSGPAAANAQIRQFQLNFWENLRANDRCGSCHDPASATPQTPYFARNDDVNLAYDALIDSNGNSRLSTTSVPFIDTGTTSDSYVSQKVVNHNCWLGPSNGSVCADIMTAYIDNWLGSTGSGSTKQIQLVPPTTLSDPGDSKNWPSDDIQGAIDFSTLPTAATSLHGLLSTHCAGCHVSSSRNPQAPFFAEADADQAYAELKASQKIDLDNPSNSRIVVRLRDESHNCWTPEDCPSDAAELEAAVTAFAANLTITPVAQTLMYSKALKLSDAIVASGGDRYENNVIALYEFKRGTGNVAYDTSGVSPSLDLSLSGGAGDVTWVRGYGLQFKGIGKAQGSVSASQKLHDMIKDIGEYSLEAWVTPANVTQEGPAHIVSYMADTNNRNFTLGQALYEYTFHSRTNATSGDGGPASMTANETLQAALQHVVVTVDPVNGRQIFVNGNRVLQDTSVNGTFANWSAGNGFAFVLGNTPGGTDPWAGQVRLVAIHNRALNQTQIQQNFDVGVGAKFLMLFSVKEHTCPGNTDPNQCSDFVMFEVSEFDNYSYLFRNPVFIRLSNDALASDVRIRGMRIGMNGKEVSVGQAYRNIDITVSTTDDIQTGVPLSTLGTVIASQKGSDGDEFFLTFEQLVAVSTHNYTEAGATGLLVDPNEQGLAANPVSSDIGVRTFDEINDTMARLTGVDPFAGTAPNRIYDQYLVLQQQLPAVERINGFVSAHQMGIAQLSIAYCDALVEDSGARTSFFGNFGFTSDVDTAFGSGDSAQKNQIVNALYNKMIGLPGTGGALPTAPGLSTIKAELIGPATTNPNNLFDRLYNGCTSNLRSDGNPRNPLCVLDQSRTRATVKAMCASVLGSAVMLVQ